MDPLMLSAFPKALGVAARRSIEGLTPPLHPTSDRLIQDSYECRWGQVIVDADEVKIPYRHYQGSSTPIAVHSAEMVRQAWLTRSWDGRVRQSAVREVLSTPASWHPPFVVQLCGEYVIEIARDIAEYVSVSLPGDPAMLDAYRRFWSDNPEFVSLTFARVASYWDAYYRGTVPLDEYPARAALLQIKQLIRQ